MPDILGVEDEEQHGSELQASTKVSSVENR
jgi:hypothetical protein